MFHPIIHCKKLSRVMFYDSCEIKKTIFESYKKEPKSSVYANMFLMFYIVIFIPHNALNTTKIT